MKEFANKSQFNFDPVPASVDLTATGVNYTTPVAHSESLGDLARLTFLRAEARFAFRTSSTDAIANVSLKTVGGSVLWTQQVDLSAADRDFSTVVEVSGVNGAAQLVWECDVTSAGTGTATFAGVLNVESPLIIS